MSFENMHCMAFYLWGPVAAELALEEGKGKDVARSDWS